MNGYLEERGGSYLIRVSLGKDSETKKYRQYTETVKTTSKPEAQKRLREVVSQLDKGMLVKPTKDTVGQYLDKWLEDYCWPNLSPRSAEGYQYLVKKYIKPKIGNIALKTLRPDQVQSLYTSLVKQGLSNRTVRYVHTTLHKCLKSAVKLGLIARNVTEMTDPPKVKRKEMTFIDESAVHKFLQAAKETPYFSMAYLFMTTGLRRSELLALRWSDIDLEKSTLSVTRTIHQLRYAERKGEIVYKEPKSAKSRRSIPIPASTVQVMQTEHDNQLSVKQSLNLDIDPKTKQAVISKEDLIFCHLDKSPILPDTVTHSFIRIAQQAGLKDVHLHTLRHSHASLLIKQGVHLKVIQERLGHSSIQVTGDIYSHVAPGLQEAAIQNFDNLMTGNKALPAGNN